MPRLCREKPQHERLLMIENSNSLIDAAALPMVGDHAAPAAAFPPAPVSDEGVVRLGGQAPMFLPHAGSKVALGGQAPMFVPSAIADLGLVRLGGQSPAF